MGYNNRAVIFGNGTLDKRFLKNLNPGDYIIGVDRAAYWLIKEGRVPDVAIGDFDSVSEKERVEIQKQIKNIQKYEKEKNETDMELAIQFAIQRKPDKVLIFGGIGTRMDHSLGTLSALELLLAAKIPHAVIDAGNHIQLVGRGRTILQAGDGYQYVSILPVTQTISLKLSGFRYNLPKTTIVRGSTRGISNEITSRRASIVIYSGIAWLIESNDAFRV